jgi:hypothetical protein
MKKLLVFLVLVLLIIGAVGAYFVFGSYSEGFRAGTVIKLSKKGVAFKTYEGQLNLGLVLSEGDAGITATEISNIWEFSVLASDTTVLRKLEEVMLNGYRAKLHYAEKYMKLPWRGETRYLVNEVESLGEPVNPDNQPGNPSGQATPSAPAPLESPAPQTGVDSMP